MKCDYNLKNDVSPQLLLLNDIKFVWIKVIFHWQANKIDGKLPFYKYFTRANIY